MDPKSIFASEIYLLLKGLGVDDPSMYEISLLRSQLKDLVLEPLMQLRFYRSESDHFTNLNNIKVQLTAFLSNTDLGCSQKFYPGIIKKIKEKINVQTIHPQFINPLNAVFCYNHSSGDTTILTIYGKVTYRSQYKWKYRHFRKYRYWNFEFEYRILQFVWNLEDHSLTYKDQKVFLHQ